MKVGDKYPVEIAGQKVTEATVKELADGTVTLEFIGQRVVMATRTELSTPPVNVDGSGTQTIIEGVERQNQEAPVSETPSATVGEITNNDNQTQQVLSTDNVQVQDVETNAQNEGGSVAVEGTEQGTDSTGNGTTGEET